MVPTWVGTNRNMGFGSLLFRMGWVVARDGLEPPTPAFSGPNSPIAKRLIRFVLSTKEGFILLLLLEQVEQDFGTGFSLQFTTPDGMSFPKLSIARL